MAGGALYCRLKTVIRLVVTYVNVSILFFLLLISFGLI